MDDVLDDKDIRDVNTVLVPLSKLREIQAGAAMLDFLLATESSFIDRESVTAAMAGKQGTTS